MLSTVPRKKQRVESEQPLTIVENKVNINSSLNDDCLIQIFKNLHVKDKLMIKSVCKKWRDIGKFYWSNVKSLEISSKYFFKIFNEVSKKKQPQLYQNFCNKINSFVINLISNCGPYLNHLILNFDLDLDFSLIFSKILFYCNELTNFSLVYNETDKELSLDPVLNLLFETNKKISRVFMENVKIDGVCFSNLDASTIKELKFVKCEFKCKTYLLNFLANLKNLNILNIMKINIEGKIIQSLNKSSCQNIHEFFFEPHFRDLDLKYKKYLAEFLSKQKMLSKLRIGIYGDKVDNFLDALPEDSPKISEFGYPEPYSFSRFENLTFVEMNTWFLTDKMMKTLADCINLETLKLKTTYIYLSKVDENLVENYFSKFEKLKRFFIWGPYDEYIDFILKGLSACQNLREIKTVLVKFKDPGLQSISTLPNLRILNISESYFSKRKIANIVDKLLKLEKIYISGFNSHGLNYKLLERINSIKVKRGDSNPLKVIMFLNHSKYGNYCESSEQPNYFPLLSIKLCLKSNLYKYNEFSCDDSYDSDGNYSSSGYCFESDEDDIYVDEDGDDSEDFDDSDYSCCSYSSASDDL